MPETATEAITSVMDGLEALRNAAGWDRLRDDVWIAVTGEDRARWLNGMVTNSVQALTPNEGAYTFLLNAQGRIQGDATVWHEAERVWLQTGRGQAGSLLAWLDRFIIMDDVELAEVTPEWCGVTVAGPAAADTLRSLGLPAGLDRTLRRVAVPWRDGTLHLIHAHSPGVPRFEVWTEQSALLHSLQAELDAAGVARVPERSLELLRVLEGVPRYGTDMGDRDLPQETAQVHALHFNKGCYLGQEIVERIRSRGQVHRTFARFVLTGDRPAAGAELRVEDKAVGLLTSVASLPVDGLQLALGYVRREAVERRLPLHYTGGTAAVRAEAAGPEGASKA